MGTKISFKSVAASNSFGRGNLPCHGQIIHNKTMGMDEIAKEFAKYARVNEFEAKMYASAFSHFIVEELGKGNRINLDGLSLYLAMTGQIDGLNGRFDPKKNRIEVNVRSKAGLKEALAQLEPVNATEAAMRVSVTSVMDGTYKTEGEISCKSTVYLAGGTFLIDTTKEDEGVWLENDDGEKVARASVASSTSTTVDCNFAEPPPRGEYRIAVYTRMGDATLASPAHARRRVAVR